MSVSETLRGLVFSRPPLDGFGSERLGLCDLDLQLCRHRAVEIRPISLLRISLLRFVDSTFFLEFPMDMRIPPLKIKILLESNPLKSRVLARRLGVGDSQYCRTKGSQLQISCIVFALNIKHAKHDKPIPYMVFAFKSFVSRHWRRANTQLALVSLPARVPAWRGRSRHDERSLVNQKDNGNRRRTARAKLRIRLDLRFRRRHCPRWPCRPLCIAVAARPLPFRRQWLASW